MNTTKKVFVATHQKLTHSGGQVSGENKTVFVATYTNEGLSFQIHLGPLKFEPHKRGRQPKVPVATI